MTTTEQRHISELSLEETLERTGMTEETLYSLSEASYLIAEGDRRKQGFRNLWNRWKRGKQNMPLAVEGAIANPEQIQFIVDRGLLEGRQ